MSAGRPRIFPDADRLSAAAAGEVAAALVAAIEARGRAELMVCGGRTPVELYRRLAGLDGAQGRPPAPDWGRVHITFTDERAVPPDDEASNFRMVRDTLTAPARVPTANVHRMPADLPDLDAAAAGYEGLLPTRIDLVILGLGEDGHVASLFPGSPLLGESRRRVAAVTDAPKPPPRRLTVTPRVLDEARRVIVLATGSAKAEAVANAWADDGVASPARRLRGRDWLVDQTAAGATFES